MDNTGQAGQVKISREFFKKIPRDYADWRWALIREFLQNCFDAPRSKNVTIDITPEGDNTLLTVTNDGAPMTREILVGKLLTLGGTGKGFEGSCIGGFGVAKSLLYYCHLNYRIQTGDLLVTGTGGDYIINSQPHFHGTRSTVLVEGDHVDALVTKAKIFASLAQWPGTLTVNGEVLPCSLAKGMRRRELPWGIVYSNQSFSGLCVVRLNGQPMFRMGTRYKGCILIELKGKADMVLTANRDGLTGSYSSELSDLLVAISTDKRSALREQKAEYKRYQGAKARHEAMKPKACEQNLVNLVNLGQIQKVLHGGDVIKAVANQEDGQLPKGWQPIPVPCDPLPPHQGIKLVVMKCQEGDKALTLGTEFILKNTTGRTVPSRYTPGPDFADYSKDLVQAWVGILLKIHQLDNRSGEFSVGFTVDEENEAEFECGPYGNVFYINPVKVDRKFKQRYNSAWSNRFELISIAAHEYVHGAYGLGEHDEDYANTFTDVMSRLLGHIKELEALCKPAEKPLPPMTLDVPEPQVVAL